VIILFKYKKMFLFLLLFLSFFDTYIFKINIGPIYISVFILSVFILFFLIMFLNLKNEFHIILDKTVVYYLVFLLFWFIYGIIQLFWTDNLVNGMQELFYLLFFIILIFGIINLISQKRDIKYLYKIVYYLVVVTTLLGISEIIFNFHLSGARQIYGKIYASGLFYNPNDFSFFNNLFFPFICVDFYENKINNKLINVLLILFIFIITIINKSTLSLIVLTLQFIIIFIFYVKNRYNLFLISISSFIAIIYFKINNNLSFFIPNSNSVIPRLELIFNGLYALYSHYLLGVGPSGYQDHINPEIVKTNILDPHNWWIELLTNYGIFIFVIYLIIFFLLLNKILTIIKKNDTFKYIYISAFVSLIGYFLGSPGMSSVFPFKGIWIVQGISLGLINYYYIYHVREKAV